MKENLKMQAPWEVFARELEALFAKDPAVAVETDFGGERFEDRGGGHCATFFVQCSTPCAPAPVRTSRAIDS